MKSRGASGNISGRDYTGDPKPPSASVSGPLKSHPPGSRGRIIDKEIIPNGRWRGAGGAVFGYDVKWVLQAVEGETYSLKVSTSPEVRNNLCRVLSH